MGHDVRSMCTLDTRRLLCLMGAVFAMVLMIQYFDLPYGNLWSSLFSASKVQTPVIGSHPTGNFSQSHKKFEDGAPFNGLDMTYENIISEWTNMTTKSAEEKGKGHKYDSSIDKNKNSDVSFQSDNAPVPKNDSFLSQNSTKEKTDRNDRIEPLKDGVSDYSFSPEHVSTDNTSSLRIVSGGNNASASVSDGNIIEDLAPQSSASAQTGSPAPSPAPSNFPEIVITDSKQPVTSFIPNITSMDKDAANMLHSERPTPLKSDIGTRGSPAPSPFPAIVDANLQPPVTSLHNEGSRPLQNDLSAPGNNISKADIPAVKEGHDKPTTGVLSISEMRDMLVQSRASFLSVKPRWSSAVDQELLYAKSQIENAPTLKNDRDLYAPLYQNVSMFKRSYELMEQTLKVYIYKEGKKPVFHTPNLKGIYASEGWFMKQLKANKHFVTKDPRKAHLFYLPFSSQMLEEKFYVPNSHSFDPLIRCLKDYLDVIVSRHSFWNRTGGADHFLVACHDWAPAETKRIMANCIKALCNADIKEKFVFGKDASLPETYVRLPQKPLRDLGGKPASRRPILAFFAGRMHGYVRPILLQHWENKDPDMKIFGQMPKVKGQMTYEQHMKSSKYCICARGYEVNSPRVVEAIFYECVPVIISDNFVPPFLEVLNWESFAVFVLEKDIPNLKNILLSIPEKRYRKMHQCVKQVQKHFLWHTEPLKYDIFHMILHSVWYNRVFQMKVYNNDS